MLEEEKVPERTFWTICNGASRVQRFGKAEQREYDHSKLDEALRGFQSDLEKAWK